MNERLKESLSALLDGEVNELELQRILSSGHRNDVSIYWQRYHAVREFVRQDVSLQVKIDIRAAVMEAINNEEPPHKA